jgi:hypothetical protein
MNVIPPSINGVDPTQSSVPYGFPSNTFMIISTPTNAYGNREQYTNIPAPHDGPGPWDSLGPGKQAVVILVILMGTLAVVLLSSWFCCGCCGLRRRRRKRIEAQQQSGVDNTRSIPLHTIANRIPGVAPRGDVPPPQYEEVVPPQHTTVAGGIGHVREEDSAIVADGKTPLSEIPFEDVVLDRSVGEGSSRTFENRHYGLGGDTTGHTNS